MLLEYQGRRPELAVGAWVAPGATVIGAVRLHPGASVWYGCVVRGDGDTIEIGEGSNIQDGSVVHSDPGFPVVVGPGVSVGHRAILHGCTVEENVLVGMGAVVLNGARVGRDCLIAAGTVLLEGMVVPPGSLVAGVPGKVRRELTQDEVERVRENARVYRGLTREHAQLTATTEA